MVVGKVLTARRLFLSQMLVGSAQKANQEVVIANQKGGGFADGLLGMNYLPASSTPSISGSRPSTGYRSRSRFRPGPGKADPFPRRIRLKITLVQLFPMPLKS